MVMKWCFFVFKQKTAYEMRISDWSSDVCSSDLAHLDPEHEAPLSGEGGEAGFVALKTGGDDAADGPRGIGFGYPPGGLQRHVIFVAKGADERCRHGRPGDEQAAGVREARAGLAQVGKKPGRSEEHKSELQAPMRTSYA